jgi:hypothetical protein
MKRTGIFVLGLFLQTNVLALESMRKHHHKKHHPTDSMIIQTE